MLNILFVIHDSRQDHYFYRTVGVKTYKYKHIKHINIQIIYPPRSDFGRRRKV